MDVEGLKDELFKAASKLVNLKIMTVVGEPTVTLNDARGPVHDSIKPGASSIGTTINMIEGDISTVISTAIATGDLKEIRGFHDSMVTKAEGIVSRNVKMLQAIIEQFTGPRQGGQ